MKYVMMILIGLFFVGCKDDVKVGYCYVHVDNDAYSKVQTITKKVDKEESVYYYIVNLGDKPQIDSNTREYSDFETLYKDRIDCQKYDQKYIEISVETKISQLWKRIESIEGQLDDLNEFKNKAPKK